MTTAAARLLLAACGVATLALSGTDCGAQVGRPPRDSTARRTPPGAAGRMLRGVGATDTTKADSAQKPLVEWAPDDSVMQELLRRQGYVATRYQGDTVRFDVAGKALHLEGHPAAVEREQSVLIGDTIIYLDSLQRLIARGDTVVLRDPTQEGTSDLVAQGELVYDVATRRGTVTNIRTSVTSGEEWHVMLHRGGVALADSALGQQTAFYGYGGSITSCDLAEPHYHFQARQIKVVRNSILVARPAVLYIGDVPVAWLPFVFQDLRSGRRSGVLPPRFGVSELIRSSPDYRRQIENLGYYFAINDYMSLATWLDWRSGARATETDPGYSRYNADWEYRWLDRFMRGQLGADLTRNTSGDQFFSVTWDHSQEFSLTSRFSANVNYTSNTRAYRQTNNNPIQVISTIGSRASYSRQVGPFALSLGGTRTQYVGRDEVNQTLPTLGISSPPINLARWLVWSPNFSLNNQQTFNREQGAGVPFRYFFTGGVLDSARIQRNERRTSMTLGTPLRIFDFTWNNSFAVNDISNQYPEQLIIPDVLDPKITRTVLFSRTFRTTVDWTTGISLPSLSQGHWNIVPSVNLSNVYGGPFWVRSQFTGGQFIHQSKRPQFSLSASPTFFGLFPGIGGFGRFRHAISPSLSYSFAPKADVSDDYLRALGVSRGSEAIAIQQQSISLGLTQNVEARWRAPADSAPEAGQKVRILSLNVSPISYDFQLARELRRRGNRHGWAGLTTDRFSYSFRSDLLPGFDYSSSYSLFQGSVRSDTAVFKPYRESITASLTLNRGSNPFELLMRAFGRAVPTASPELGPGTLSPSEAQEGRDVARQPVAGSRARNQQLALPTGQGWSLSLAFSQSRQRPPVGTNIITIDPEALCQVVVANPILFDQCVAAESQRLFQDTLGGTGGIRQVVRTRPRTALNSSFNFTLTPKWSGSWTTNYNFEEKEFGMHMLTLQRDLHDWRAVFAFTQAPNGYFTFNFFIALKAQPDLKFDYNRRTQGRDTPVY